MDAKLDLVKTWLTKAERDLASAQCLAAGPDPLYDTAVYHCQLAAEKALKGWLTFHDLPFEKTHDLRLLVSLAVRINPRFAKYYETTELLTPYAIAFRYPGESLNPEPEEFQEALVATQELFRFACLDLPSEVVPKPEDNS